MDEGIWGDWGGEATADEDAAAGAALAYCLSSFVANAKGGLLGSGRHQPCAGDGEVPEPGAEDALEQIERAETPCAVLTVSEHATLHVVREQFRRLSLLVHPDKVPAWLRPRATAAFQTLRGAYEHLAAAPVCVPFVPASGVGVGRSPHIVTFTPTGYAGEPIHGAFLIDSFYYMKLGKKGKPQEYLPELLALLWRETGLVLMAVCSGGAALCASRNSAAATFAELLQCVPDGLRVLIAILCGNDFLDGRWAGVRLGARRREVYDAAAALSNAMRAKATSSFAVVGGSWETWGYRGTVAQQVAWDADADMLRQVFVACGVAAVTGARELAGVEPVDTVGHLFLGSKSIVFDAYRKWLRCCLSALLPPAENAPAAPPVPPPPPPPPLSAAADALRSVPLVGSVPKAPPVPPPPPPPVAAVAPRSAPPPPPPVAVVAPRSSPALAAAWEGWCVAQSEAQSSSTRAVVCGAGESWAICLACSLKANRWRWVDPAHFATNAHREGTRWVSQKVADAAPAPDLAPFGGHVDLATGVAAVERVVLAVDVGVAPAAPPLVSGVAPPHAVAVPLEDGSERTLGAAGGAVSNARPRRWPPRGLGAIPEVPAAYAAADGVVRAGGFAVDWDVQLGEGGFGVVFRAVRLASGNAVAVKRFKCARVDLSPEVCIQTALDHPHLCRLFDNFLVDGFLHLVMDFCEGGDLFDYLGEDGGVLPDREVAHFGAQLLSAVAFVHSRDIVHRDIKLENVLLLADQRCLKLADFGLACRCRATDRLDQWSGTVAYMAPEVFQGSYNQLRDEWACGCIFYECLRGEPLVPPSKVSVCACLAFLRSGAFYDRVVAPAGQLPQGCASLESLLRGLLRCAVEARLCASDAFVACQVVSLLSRMLGVAALCGCRQRRGWGTSLRNWSSRFRARSGGRGNWVGRG